MNQLYGSQRGRRLIAAALVVIATLALINRTARFGPFASPVERLLSDAVAPVQSFVRRVLSPLVGISREIARLRDMRDENLMMREKVLAIPWLETDLQEARLENTRLRELLKFAQAMPYQYIPAEIIGRNPDNWLQTATINKGSIDGISRDDAVVTAAGLVGRVVKVSARTSTVMLITDADSGVGGLIQRTRDAGVVVGQSGSKILKMKLFSRDADVQVGDMVITSGLGSVFPKGLPVGKVVSVGRGDYGLIKTADVAPLVNFDRLEEVLVIKPALPGPEGVTR